MSDTDSHSAATGDARPAPVETLTGDRLCMQCMHPLVGSPITREPQTGLLYVRCGECGTASALFEYPTVGPWINRMKAVASSTLVAIAFVLILAICGIALGFTAGAASTAGEMAGSALLERYRAHGGVVDDQSYAGSAWGPADMKWIDSPEGQTELTGVRWALAPLFPLLGLNLIGALVLSPFAAMLGVALMRRKTLERAIICALLVGAAGALAVVIDNIGTSRGVPSWQSIALERHAVSYALFSAVALTLTSSLAAAVAPTLAAALARFILPPADRRLLSWLWEWRGKSIPRD